MSDFDEKTPDQEEAGLGLGGEVHGEELHGEEVHGEAGLEELEAAYFDPRARKPKIYLSPKVSEDEVELILEKDEIGPCLSNIGEVFEGGDYAYLTLNVTGKNLTDITIIPIHCTCIMYLNVSDNRLDNESLLCLLPMNLLSIDASKNRITTANFPVMRFLQVLTLNYNYIRSTELISQPNLVSLSLNHNQLKEVVGLESENLPELKSLELRGNSLPDLNGIYFPNLRHLYLADNFITSLVGIEHLVNLRILHLRDNPLSELDGFTENMKHLAYINIRKCEITDLTQLRKLECLPRLETLVLSENSFTSDAEEEYRVAVLVILPNLRRIDKNPVLQEELEEAKERREGELAGEGDDDDDDDDY